VRTAKARGWVGSRLIVVGAGDIPNLWRDDWTPILNSGEQYSSGESLLQDLPQAFRDDHIFSGLQHPDADYDGVRPAR
jgi:hypothetical protein